MVYELTEYDAYVKFVIEPLNEFNRNVMLLALSESVSASQFQASAAQQAVGSELSYL